MQISVFSPLRLVGGTALALQLGHRHSIDLDFFGTFDFGHWEIQEELTAIGLEVSSRHSTGRIHIFNVDGVKVDFVNYPYNWLESCVEAENVRLASMKDIAAMKLEAVTNRGTRKDFVDVYFLLQHFSLSQMLDFYKQKYPDGSVFNVLRSLSYFVDAENDPMPKMIKKTDWEEVKSNVCKTIGHF